LKRQILTIIGSTSLLGNPVGVVRSLGAGLNDFFVEPWKKSEQKEGKEEEGKEGKEKERGRFVKQTGKGAASLMINTTRGVTSAVSGVIGAASGGLSTLAEAEYQEKRLRRERDAISSSSHMGAAALALGDGVIGGVTGLVTLPVKYAQKEGIKGFFKGIGHSVKDFFVKPVTGILDAGSHTVSAIGAVGKKEIMFKRVHDPRITDDCGRIIPICSFRNPGRKEDEDEDEFDEHEEK
ncbi:Vacuolar protein sorting-associated protein 13 like protein, partial [Aduncisulcus paluster]